MSGERYREMCRIHRGMELMPGEYDVYDADSKGKILSEVPIQRGVRACKNCLRVPYYKHVLVVDTPLLRNGASLERNYVSGIELSQPIGDLN